MKKLIRPISIVLVIAYLIMIPLSAQSVLGATSTSSDNSLLSKWKGYGLLDNSIKNDELYKPIQKIDFIMYINNILKSSKQVEVGFSDVPKGSWYAAEISKAVASGFVTNQDNANYLPFSNITRLDAAIMVARVFGLELNDKKILDTITDAEKLSNEELNNFGAVIEKGCLSEISKGRYAPTGVLKMIDAIKMLDTCMGKLVTKASTITSNVTGNMLVNTKSVTLNNIVVTGDLIIGEGVLDGTIRLQNVSVKGNLIIRGGGNNGVTLKDTKIGGKLIVEKGAGDVDIVATGTTTINQTFLKSGCSLEEVSLTGGSGFINVTSEQAVIENQTANLSGIFNNITMGNSNIDMKLTGSTDNLKITKDAEANLSLVGSAGTITTQASKNIIDMSNGIVTTFNVEDGAKGNKININGTAIIINMTVNGNSALSLNGGTVNKLTLGVSSEGSSVNIKSGAVLTTIVANAGATVTGSGKITTAYIYADNFSTDIRPNGYVVGNGISTTINGTAVSSNLPQIAISANDIVLKEGGIQLINATASPSDSTMTYISSDNSIATISEKGLITAVSAGSASIYITAQRPGYSPCSTSIKVEVSNSNVTTTGTLAISPDSAETGTKQTFQIIYTAGDNMSNGTVVIKLPTGFSVYENDTVSIAGSEAKVLEAGQRPNTQTLSFTNLNLTKGQTIIVNFNNRLVPVGGEYIFTAISDADGTGPRLPTSGQEKGTFNSNSLRVLVLGTNFKLESGTEGGTTKITKLTTLGFTGSNKWLISVKDGAFATKPNFDDSLTGSEYVEYKEGTNIKVNIGQYIRLVAVDATDGKNKVKAYKDILIEKDMVRPFSADKIVLASDSVTTGIQSNAVRINGLDSISVTGADKWMIKVQNVAAIDVFVDREFAGAKAYTSGEDISVYAGQHIILGAVDSKNNNNIKAYTDINVENNTMISKSAGKLLLGNNYEQPTYGSAVGKTTIELLDKGNLPGGFEDINKWMVVVLSKATFEPAMDISTTEFERYTEGKTFTEYAANEDIAVVAGQNILLVGVKEQDNSDGTKTSKIKAYANLAVDTTAVRQADAPAIPDGNFSAPEMGTDAGTTKLPSLDFDTKITDATKYMVIVQNDEFAPPQMNSVKSGAVDFKQEQNIEISDGQHLVLLATDDNGCIKAYKDIEVSLSQIRPGDALKLNSPNDYSAPEAGSQVGATRVVLSSNRVPDWVEGQSKWMYKLQSKPYDVPYIGSKLDGLTEYKSGDDITPVTDGQYLLIVAVDGDGKTLAYTVESINYLQIKQPSASDLKSSSEVGAGEKYNYSVPVPGQTGGTTRITSLNTFGVQGATKWLYQIADAAVEAPDYNSIISGLLPYTGDSIKVTEGQYFVLYAVDDFKKIKAFDNIQIDKAQIRTPNALNLVTPTNYAAPTAGTLEGTTVISSLSFAKLTGVDDTWSWMYVVGDKMFGAPMLDTNISTITNAQSLTTTTNIPVKAEQYILLLAVDGTKAIKGYANIRVPKEKIKPYKADDIPTTSYSLTKGTEEGTTCFNNLNLIGIDASTWMIITQKDAFEIPAKDFAISGAILYKYNSKNNPNIKIAVGEHILLLATDSSGKVKAYADITVDKDQIMAPFAMPLTEITNFTKPEQGNEQGTVKIMLNDYGVKKESGETIVWKYNIGTEVFNAPHLDDDASGTEFISYASNQDIKVSAGNSILVVAVAKDGSGNEKIKAFTQFTISSSQIRPANAPELTLDYNYSSPTAGSKPGTTKITNLKLIGIVGQPTKWQIRVSNENEKLILNSVFTNPINYVEGNIEVKLNQYVILAAVDDSGKVKAYKSIQITQDSQINPPLAEPLDKGLNYANPKYGSVTGTTSVFVSPEGLNGCKEFIAKVVDAPVDIIAGTTMTYTDALGSDYKDFHIYSSGSDISASKGQYILLVAVDENQKIIAYANVPVEDKVRPGDAITLKLTENYSKLEPGTDVGTTKFSTLGFVGIPVGEDGKWIVNVQDVDLTSKPLMNSSVESAAVYEVNSNIVAKEGQYVVLYAVDTTGKIKGYVSLKVLSSNVRGVAPLLKPTTNYSEPEPGSDLNKTLFSTLTLPEGATLWKYSVQDADAGTILKDSLLSGYNPYEQGHDITAKEGQHLVLIATDNAGGVKAYVDIKIEAKHLRNVQATLSGTAISAPTGESNIAVGGRTIIITLAYGEWQEDVLTNTTKRNALFDGLIASGDEQAQWGKVVATLKTEGAKAASMSLDKKTITITLSETATYDITKSQEVSLTIKPELIKNAVKTATSVNSIKIAADVIVKLDGTAITQGLGEGNIVAGGRTIIIYLTNGEFASDVASNEVKRNAIFNGFTATNNTDAWALVIEKLKQAGEAAITRNASNKVTIVLPAVAGVSPDVPGYDITMNETINITVPYMVVSDGKVQEILVGAIKDAVVSTALPISANASADLSGTLLEGVVAETNIVTGSKTLVIKLADGQWVTDIATNATKRNALFAGLSTSTETAELAKVIKALQDAGQAAITRTDNNTVTIILPSVSTYNISSNQYITMTIPAACIIGAKASLIAKQTITVERVAGATLTGTAVGSTVTETDIKLGGKTIIITLNNAFWIDDISTNSTVKNALFDGMVADVEQNQWLKIITALKNGLGSVTKTSTNSITITLPTVIGYDITAEKQNISVTVPISAIVGSSFNVQASNTVVINSTPPIAAKIVELKAATNTYKLGDVVTINVRFDTAVDVIGIPVLNLETGTTDRNAYYTAGSGTDILTFTYTVQEDDSALKLDYLTKDSLVLQGATIINSGSSVKAITTLPVPGNAGSLSNTSNVLIDAVAPKFSTGYPQKGTITELTADILVNVNEKATIYYVTVLNDINNSVPTVEQVKGGLNAAGTAVAAGMLGTVSVIENKDGKLAMSNLSAYTDYTVYIVLVDSLGNTSSTVSSFNFKTADTTAPQFIAGYPQQALPASDNLINILIKANEAGNVFLVAVPAGSIAPTSEQVKAYKNGSGGAVATNLRATAKVEANTEITLGITGLTVSTHYDIYVVCVDTSGNVIDTPALVTAETLQLNMDNVGVNLTKKILTNTTTQMQYSFDEQNWINCTATSTNITYDDNAVILAVFVREAKNTTNVKALPILTREDETIIDKTTITYDIANGTIKNTSAINLQYRINGGTWGTLNASGSASKVVFEPGLLEVRTAASELKLPSAPVLVDNIAVPMPAPNLVYDDSENRIEGLDSTYEFRINGGTWTTGVTDGIFAGTKLVEVRQKAETDKLPSVAQVINFTAGTVKVVAEPWTDDATLVATVTITFEENTNKVALTAQNINDWFTVGTWNTTSGELVDQHNWGTDFTAVWNTAGNVLTIKYKTMADSTVEINDEVRIDALAGIKNAAGTSASYTSTGLLTGSFHTVPAIKSVQAVNANNTIGFNNGDQIVITFDQPTIATAITKADIDTLLKVTDSTGLITRTWGIVNDSDIVWNSDGTKLTITFADVTKTDITLKDKLTVSTALGLTDADQTTEACNSSSFISGSFTSTPEIMSVTIANGGVAGTKNVGDTITITFDQATNKKTIKAYQLDTWLTVKTSAGVKHSWGAQSDANITWSADGKTLTIKLSSISGVTITKDDILYINTLAGIKAADGGTAACGDSKVIGGGY